RELPQLRPIVGLAARPSGHDLVEPLEELLYLASLLSLDRGGHEGGRCLGDRAARALEAHVGDHVALELEPNRELVSAKWVASLGVAIGVVHSPEVPRRAVVLEDHVLIQ